MTFSCFITTTFYQAMNSKLIEIPYFKNLSKKFIRKRTNIDLNYSNGSLKIIEDYRKSRLWIESESESLRGSKHELETEKTKRTCGMLPFFTFFRSTVVAFGYLREWFILPLLLSKKAIANRFSQKRYNEVIAFFVKQQFIAQF